MMVNVPIDTLRESIIHSLIMTILVLFLLVPMVTFINKYVSFLLGKNL